MDEEINLEAEAPKRIELDMNEAQIVTTKSVETQEKNADTFEKLLATEKEQTKSNQSDFVRAIYADKSLFMFGPNSKLRIFTIKITKHKWFESLIFFTIFLNCVTLAMERPAIQPDSFVSLFSINCFHF